MNAEPLLNAIAKALADHRLEAIMVGNAAAALHGAPAALHGAPVTTLDVDFMFRKTPANLKKLKAVARQLGVRIFKRCFPNPDLFRVFHDDIAVQLDFMPKLDGVRSFESLRSRATSVAFGAHELKIASLADIIKSKRAAGRDRDKAVLEILERTLDEHENVRGG
jgi:hypothetical protein